MEIGLGGSEPIADRSSHLRWLASMGRSVCESDHMSSATTTDEVAAEVRHHVDRRVRMRATVCSQTPQPELDNHRSGVSACVTPGGGTAPRLWSTWRDHRDFEGRCLAFQVQLPMFQTISV